MESPGYRSVSSANEAVTQGAGGEVVTSLSGWLSAFLPSTSSKPEFRGSPPPTEFRGPPPPTVDGSPTPRSTPLLGGGLGLSAMDTVKAANAGTRTPLTCLSGSGGVLRAVYGLLGVSLLALLCVPLGLYLSLLARNAAPSSSPDGHLPSPSGPPPPVPSPSGPPPPMPPPPPPSPQSTNDTLACARAAGAWLNASVWGRTNRSIIPFDTSFNCRSPGPFQLSYWPNGGRPYTNTFHEGTVLPLPTDLFMTSMASACDSPEVAALTRAAYLATPQDICYFYAYTAGQSGSTPPALSTWATQIDPARLWTFPLPAFPGKGEAEGGGWDPVLRGFADTAAAAAAAAAEASGVGGCKWWLMTSNSAWVNPRAVLQAVQGVPWDTVPLVLGNFWFQMGFFYMSTVPSGTALFSQVAVRALGGLGSGAGKCLGEGKAPPPACTSDGGCRKAYLWYCLLTEGGVIPVHLQNTDASGALTANGVPMEPGPPFPTLVAYLTQPHQLATHFAWVDNVDSSVALWPAYRAVYGAWGLLRGGEGEGEGEGSARVATAAAAASASRRVPSSPTPSPAGAAAAAAAAAVAAPECVSNATSLLREFLEAGRTAPTSATPLSPDLVGEVMVAACGPLPLPLPSARSLLFALAQVNPADSCSGVNALRQNGWGWEYAQQLYVFGPPPLPAAAAGCQGVIGDASFQGVNASAAGAQLLAAVSRELEGRGGSISAYPWVFLGGERSLVNPQALAGLTAGLHPDMPLALSFYLASPLGGGGPPPPTPTPPPSTSMRPAGGLLLLSRAAVALVMPLLGTPQCPLSGGDPLEVTLNGGALGRCLWAAGVLPVHTFSMDPLGFYTPAIDWTYSQMQIQTAFAVSMIPGAGFMSPTPFSFRHLYQERTYCGCANLTSACNATRLKDGSVIHAGVFEV